MAEHRVRPPAHLNQDQVSERLGQIGGIEVAPGRNRFFNVRKLSDGARASLEREGWTVYQTTTPDFF